MSGAETVAKWLDEGRLVHPTRNGASSVDLVHALAGLAGDGRAGREETPPRDPDPEQRAGAEGAGPRGPEGLRESESFGRREGFRDPEASRDRARLRERIGEHEHIVLVLIDGLGMNHRELLAQGSFFASASSMRLSSVFPSATACALPSFATGDYPARHALTGWWTHIPEVSRTICPLTFRERFTGLPAVRLGLTHAELIESAPLPPAAHRHTMSLLPAPLHTEPFSRWARGETSLVGYRSFGRLRRRLLRWIRRAPGPTFTYVYTSTVDAASHIHGIHGAETERAIAHHDRLLTRLRDGLPDSCRMVVTADHGLIDVDEAHRIQLTSDHPLRRCLEIAPTGEGTAPVFHVLPHRRAEFLDAFAQSRLSDSFVLLTPDELEELRLYGPGPISPTLRARLGDFVGIAAEHALLEYEDKPATHLAVHGGLRPGEMEVPLFVA